MEFAFEGGPATRWPGRCWEQACLVDGAEAEMPWSPGNLAVGGGAWQNLCETPAKVPPLHHLGPLPLLFHSLLWTNCHPLDRAFRRSTGSQRPPWTHWKALHRRTWFPRSAAGKSKTTSLANPECQSLCPGGFGPRRRIAVLCAAMRRPTGMVRHPFSALPSDRPGC